MSSEDRGERSGSVNEVYVGTSERQDVGMQKTQRVTKLMGGHQEQNRTCREIKQNSLGTKLKG